MPKSLKLNLKLVPVIFEAFLRVLQNLVTVVIIRFLQINVEGSVEW